MRVVGVIPARYGSTRFPGKPLALLQGKALILHVIDRLRATKHLEEIVVATDDRRILDVAQGHDCKAVMTSDQCQSGSDRVAEVAADQPWEIVLNVQGDEPTVDPGVLDAVVEALDRNPDCGVSTAMVPIHDRSDFFSPHVVKVVCDPEGRAFYFSRSPIPSPDRLEASAADEPGFIWGMKHLGIYAFRKEVLMSYAKWQPAELEQREQLEQLRLLDHGVNICVVRTEHDSIGVDTPEELEQLERSLAGAGG